MKNTLAAFKANKFVVDVAKEVFQAATPVSSARPPTHAAAPSLALVLVSGGSHFAASRTLVPLKASVFSKALSTPKVPKEPIIVNESPKSSSKEGTRSPPLDVSLIRVVGDRQGFQAC